MSLMDKLKKNSTVKEADSLQDSQFFKPKDMAQTDVPAINIALSGRLDGGVSPGLLVLAGPSKHFKTNFSLKMAQAYLNKHEDAVLLFYDTEFGSPQEYFESFGIPLDRVFHTPVDDIEEMRHDLANQLDNIEKGDKVIIIIDSVGNAASRKESEDALSGKSVADMTRAKVMKSLFRIVTPKLKRKEIPMIAINHTYQSMEMFSKPVVSGGCVVEGTKIQTHRGLVEIQDVREDDIIITQYGNKEVKALWNPDTLDEGTPECFEIEFEDGYKVTCSADHKFIVDGKWIAAKDLIVNMDCKAI